MPPAAFRGRRKYDCFTYCICFVYLIHSRRDQAPLYCNQGDPMSDRSKKRAAGPSRRPDEAPRSPERVEITVDGARIEVSPHLEAAVLRAYKGMSPSSLPSEMTTT